MSKIGSRVWVGGFRDTVPIMESQMDKKIRNEMETVIM